MKIEFLKFHKSPDGRSYTVGQIVNLPEAEARAIIDSGAAREFKITVTDPDQVY